MDFTSEDRERPEQFTNMRKPWEDLSSAVIRKACEDYEFFSGPGRVEIERFIRSPWFGVLSNIEPEWLIKKLRETFRPRTSMIGGYSGNDFKKWVNK